jgi:hypothetical protein
VVDQLTQQPPALGRRHVGHGGDHYWGDLGSGMPAQQAEGSTLFIS